MDFGLIFKSFFALILAYVIGSISLGYFLAKAKGIDLRKAGPIKNIGTSNVRHVLGLPYAIATALWDISKGIISVLIGIFLGLPIFFLALIGLFAIIGHCFPFYLDFKGGRGAATAYGLIIFGLIAIIINQELVKVYLPLLLIALVSFLLLFITKAKNLTAIIAALLVFFFFSPRVSTTYIWILNIGFFWLALLGIIAIKEKGWKA